MNQAEPAPKQLNLKDWAMQAGSKAVAARRCQNRFLNHERYMNLEELVTAYKEIAHKIDELEKAKKSLSQSIMQEMKTKSVQVGSYMVRRHSRLSIRVSLDHARILDAIKIEETVDKDRIKEIYQQGQPIEGVSEIQYVTVSKTRDSSEQQTE